MKAAIFGIGRMGVAITWAMKKFDFDVVCVDADPNAADRIKALFGEQKFVYYRTKTSTFDVNEILEYEKPDVVISSLPYHQTLTVARCCIDKGIRYCDLGGRVDTSEEINDYSREVNNSPVMTDLGLAPGWVNILAEQGCREVHGIADSVKMRVGGLPYRRIQPEENPLRYVLTWSTDGLINEYKDDCVILQHGKAVTVPGMGGYNVINTTFGDFEEFYTSGGSAHTIHSMQSRGVKHCDYKTLRYPGHIHIVQFLMNNCGFTDEQLAHVFEKGCGFAEQDVVFLLAEVTKGDVTWKKELKITSDFRFSAMQRATAFPISSVARMLAEGVFDERKDERRGYYDVLPLQLTYKDVPFDTFKKYLKELKLDT